MVDPNTISVSLVVGLVVVSLILLYKGKCKLEGTVQSNKGKGPPASRSPVRTSTG